MESFPSGGNIGDDAWLSFAIDTVKSSTIVRIMLSPPTIYSAAPSLPFAKRRIPISTAWSERMGRAEPMTCINRRWPALIRSANRKSDLRICEPSVRYSRLSDSLIVSRTFPTVPDWPFGLVVKYEKINWQFLPRFIDGFIRRCGLNRDQHLWKAIVPRNV